MSAVAYFMNSITAKMEAVSAVIQTEAPIESGLYWMNLNEPKKRKLISKWNNGFLNRLTNWRTNHVETIQIFICNFFFFIYIYSTQLCLVIVIAKLRNFYTSIKFQKFIVKEKIKCFIRPIIANPSLITKFG